MSNDNKTLADAQPGGRVRLATVPYDRARDLLGDAYNAGTHGIGYSQQAMELHDAIFSAPPSPGGQGDASRYWPEVDRILVDAYVAGSEGDEFDMIAARNAIHAALAARQPVASSQPSGNSGELAADTQPVGERPMEMRVCELRHVSLKPNQPYIFTVDANCANCRADAAYVLGHTAPPAQAVDLGAVRDAVQGITLGFDGDLPYVKGIAEALALIDSQAVGNG